jgi:integrase
VEEQHFAAVTTSAEIGGILRAIDAYKGMFVVQCDFRLAPLVFARPGELRTARWPDIDLDEEQWLLKLSKRDDSKPRRPDVDDHLIVPLSRQAMEILRTVHSLAGKGVYVFPGARDRNRPMSANAIPTAMRRMEISKDEMCGHGFRAAARAIIVEELHIREDLIEHELGQHMHVRDRGRRGAYRVHDAFLAVDSEVRLGAKIPLVAFAGLMHLRIAFLLAVLGRRQSRDNGSADDGARADADALARQAETCRVEYLAA